MDLNNPKGPAYLSFIQNLNFICGHILLKTHPSVSKVTKWHKMGKKTQLSCIFPDMCIQQK